MKDRLIAALDFPSLDEARRSVRLLKKTVTTYKVGLELFSSVGPDAVKMVHDEGGRVFLDLKFHDIPNTVARACETASRLGVFMMNVHARGGRAMMEAAAKASGKSLLVGVTVLTSDAATDDTEQEVVRLARASKSAGLGGVVCSALEAPAVRQACGKDFLIVTPGIRPSGSEKGDQKRISTPRAAIEAGADYLVIGRPLWTSPDPIRTLEALLKEMA